MVNNSKIEELSASLTLLTTKIKAAAAKVRQFAFLADNADTLGGQNITAVRAQLDASIAAHIADKNNPHGETAASIGIPLKSVVDAQLAKLIPSGVLPISNYGSQDYLPPNVAGSFEGGTTASSPKITAMIVEGDGTLVILRNGTNGSRSGIFYAYVKNALNSPAITDPIKTNKKYRPAYFPVGYSAAKLLTWGDTALYGQLQNDATGELGDYFLSITNGTFDDTKHTGCIIPQANGIGINAGALIVAGDFIYHFNNLITGYSQPLDVQVRTIPRAAVIAGTATTWTLVTGFETTGFSGVVNATDIRLANRVAGPDPATKPMLLTSGPTAFTALNFTHFEHPGIIAVTDPVSGIIRLKWIGVTYAATAAGSSFRYMTFSIQFNPATKKAWLDSGLGAQNGIVFNGSSVSITGPIYNTVRTVDAARDESNTRRDHYISDAGFIFGFRIQQTIDSTDIMRSKIGNFVSKFESARYGAITSAAWSAMTCTPTFGTAIGGGLVGALPVSLNKIATYSFGRNAAGASTRGTAWSALDGTAEDFTYRSIMSGTMKGWRPSADRSFLADIAMPEMNVGYPVVEISSTAVTPTGYNFIGADLTGSTRRSRINANFTLSGDTLTVPDAILTAIASAVYTPLAATLGNLTQSSTQVVVPNVLDCPPFALVHIYSNDGRTHFMMCRLALTISANVVTGFVVSEVSTPILYTSQGTGLNRIKSMQNMLGAVTLYDVGTAVLIGIASPIGKSTVGSSPPGFVRFKYQKAQGKFVYPVGLGAVHNTPLSEGARCWFAHPSLGFGMLTGDLGSTSSNDFFTKIVFVPYAKTEATFDTWTAGPKADWRVIASQDVAEGWMLYFTDQQPAFLAGQAYTLQPVNINLLDITPSPANKKFYVYVQLTLGIPKYVVRETEINDSETTIYIGYVTTNDINIASIVVSKVYRIGTFRLSNSPTGSAIPSSAGHPADVGTLTWT